jgi:hypothetical protein
MSERNDLLDAIFAGIGLAATAAMVGLEVEAERARIRNEATREGEVYEMMLELARFNGKGNLAEREARRWLRARDNSAVRYDLCSELQRAIRRGSFPLYKADCIADWGRLTISGRWVSYL